MSVFEFEVVKELTAITSVANVLGITAEELLADCVRTGLYTLDQAEQVGALLDDVRLGA
jgi:hypothetical protein